MVNSERRRRVDSEAKVISFDEMWTYVGSRRKGKRNSVWIWTAVVEEEDGSKWMDYEVGDRGEETFLRLYERSPDAKRYRSDDCNAYRWLPIHYSRKPSEHTIRMTCGVGAALLS